MDHPSPRHDPLTASDERATALGLELEAVVTRFQRLLRQAGSRRGLQGADVEELVQEVRIRLWRAAQRGENPGALPASYVYRVASTAAVDLLRRRRDSRLAAVELAADAEGRPADTPAAAQAARELEEAVERALDRLVPSRRPVVRMHLAGHERAEIAALLGWTEAKTRNLLYRGLADLREALAAAGYRTTAGEGDA